MIPIPLFRVQQCIQNSLAITAVLGITLCSVACKKAPTPDVESQVHPISDIEKLGGTVLTIRVLPGRSNTGEEIPVTAEHVAHTITAIEKRISHLGISNLHIKSLEQDQISLELIATTQDQLQLVRKTIQTPALLELKTVYPENRILADRVAADPENEIVPGYELKVLRDTDDEGNPTSENLLIARRAALDSSHVKHAQELYGPYEGELTVELSAEGGERMFQLTNSMAHGRDRLAIVLDGKVLSAPVVQATLRNKFQISGMTDAAEAKNLAAALTNPLTNPLRIEKERTIEPSSSK